LGHLAQSPGDWSREHLKQACIHGCLLASYTVQDFGVEGIARVGVSDLEERLKAYRQVIT
jgi:hypothetical protein